MWARVFTAAAFGVVLGYVLCAFVGLDLNPAHWTPFGRFLCVAIMAAIAIGLFALDRWWETR